VYWRGKKRNIVLASREEWIREGDIRSGKTKCNEHIPVSVRAKRKRSKECGKMQEGLA